MKVFVLALVVTSFASATVPASASSSTESVGKDVAIALPVIAGGVTIWKSDWTGMAQLAVSGVATVGTVYALKHLVRECRPFATLCTRNGKNWDSFPSGTSAVAFAPAQFLWQRYGWEYGVPAYAAATFVGYSRIDSREHHWWDVVASAAISLGYNEIFTTRYHPPMGFTSDLSASPDGVYATVHYRW